MRFPTKHMFETLFLLEYLPMSQNHPLEKFQRSFALDNIKYNSSILFFEIYILIIYLCSQTTIVKPSQNSLKVSKQPEIDVLLQGRTG